MGAILRIFMLSESVTKPVAALIKAEASAIIHIAEQSEKMSVISTFSNY